MKRKFQIVLNSLILGTIVYLFLSCNAENGIAPKPVADKQFGFGGNITFYGVWPDSITRIILVVFRDPLKEPGDFVLTNIAYLSYELPLRIQNFTYSSLDSALIPLTQSNNPPSEFNYIAVAQQSTEELSLRRKDWFVTGVYYSLGDTTNPGVLSIPQDSYIDGININCDFENPPVQPPGGN